MPNNPIINLSSGELLQNPQPSVIAAAQQALAQGKTGYGPTDGIYELREALAAHYHADEANIGPENFIITPGVRYAVHNVLQYALEPGDEVIITAPYWFSFPDLIKQAGGVMRVLETSATDNFHISKRQLLKLINEKTRVFILCNPCNPSGHIYNKDELEDLFAVLQQYTNILILADEIYESMVYAPGFHRSGKWQAVADRLITVSGFSKTYAMSGLRVGYILAATKHIHPLRELQHITLGGIPISLQMAALEAVNSRHDYLPALLADLMRRRDTAMGHLQSVEKITLQKPDATFYLFPNIAGLYGLTAPSGQTMNSVEDLVAWLLVEHGIQVFNGRFFGLDHHIRLSFNMAHHLVDEYYSQLATALRTLQ